MGDQEKYKLMLKKLIEQTENFKIQSSEELIQALVNELRSDSFSSNSIANK
ncbi:hypothetical protein GCM10011409_36000 [Lentibacillus populi]|uniref:Uncharacterized protein n=1 Tax=Lentibacillus populi TaxID=1827502 RepID=A0A9W5X6S1_9BACI|nr:MULTISPECIES: hypothetical protein [Bacillaceae]MBT2216082.1 hypothetical protein [Virgibacillus dakarensis]GGB55188.1 hypothetical protein GCM10011409_36000 [Lentibacillus populi]